jgi:hypothetical protein
MTQGIASLLALFESGLLPEDFAFCGQHHTIEINLDYILFYSPVNNFKAMLPGARSEQSVATKRLAANQKLRYS